MAKALLHRTTMKPLPLIHVRECWSDARLPPRCHWHGTHSTDRLLLLLLPRSSREPPANQTAMNRRLSEAKDVGAGDKTASCANRVRVTLRTPHGIPTPSHCAPRSEFSVFDLLSLQFRTPIARSTLSLCGRFMAPPGEKGDDRARTRESSFEE